MSAKRIVIVEDEEVLRFGTTLHLKSFGYDVVGNFSSGEEAIGKIADLKPDVILMDIELAGEMSGIETAKVIKQKVDIPLIYLSVHSDTETIEKAESTHPFRYMNKPFHDEELKFTIEMAIKNHEMEKELWHEIDEYKEILSNLPGLVYVYYSEDNSIKIGNDMFEDITGFKWDEMEQKEYHFMLPLIIEEDREKLENAISSPDSKQFEVHYRIKDKNGDIRKLKEIIKSVIKKESSFCNYGIILDITDN